MKALLTGITALVTRPQPGNAELCDRITAAGGKALAWPAIEVSPLPLSVSSQQALKQLTEYTGVIFVSVNAVTYGINYLLSAANASTSLQWLAVGKTTAQALHKQGIIAEYPRQTASSEALLALPQLRSGQGQRWLIVRGESGRELLAETLRSRGAQVDYLAAYQTSSMPFPAISPRSFLRHHSVTVIIFTSMALIEVFLRYWDGSAAELFQLPIVVVSERMQREATALGFGKIYLATSAYPEHILSCLQQLRPIIL